MRLARNDMTRWQRAELNRFPRTNLRLLGRHMNLLDRRAPRHADNQ
jgi:hypothetical protein